MLKPPIASEFESLRPEGWKDLPVGFSSLGGRWKLLHVSPESGAWTAAFLNPKGSTVPAHIHVGPGEYFLVKGKLEVRGGDAAGGTTAEAPGYGYEATGARHDVTIFLEDSETYMRFQGPLQMIDEKGNTVGIYGWQEMQALWNAT